MAKDRVNERTARERVRDRYREKGQMKGSGTFLYRRVFTETVEKRVEMFRCDNGIHTIFPYSLLFLFF